MTINGGSAWATSLQSSKIGGTQSQDSVSSANSTDNFSSMMQQVTEMLVSTLDTNKDGAIDKNEFSQASQALSQKTGNTYDADSAFSAIDKNGDQSMSVDELLSALKQSQGKHGHGGHHKADSSQGPTDVVQQLSQATTAPDDSSSSKMQAALLQRILSAYTNGSSTATASTTLSMA
ncbi:EF-hand domain-containing protein [Sulfurimonas sp.]|uniref:EF-hand domain-containing protein n=1 Tax=Sulfurimonas sp. TaxID=2022749 RepID=UPI0025CB83CF|nr:EF-hand domain-containing protein [Sulfurimonas sp.]MDD5158141.1 EF-hand domain-containing protein [Sulfurimonas sp.]